MIKRIIRKSILATMYYIYFLWYKIVGPPNVLLLRGSMNNDILKAFGAKIGNNVTILPPLTIASVQVNNGYSNLSVGDNCIIGGNVFFDLADRIILEDGVSIGPGVIIMTHKIAIIIMIFLKKSLPVHAVKRRLLSRKVPG